MKDATRPACFTQDEWDGWVAGAMNVRPGKPEVPSPCWDCLPLYAVEQRMHGRCDGHPFGAEEDTEPAMAANSLASSIASKKRKAEKMALVVKLYQDGHGPKSISVATGFALNTVHWYLREWRYDAA